MGAKRRSSFCSLASDNVVGRSVVRLVGWSVDFPFIVSVGVFVAKSTASIHTYLYFICIFVYAIVVVLRNYVLS